MKRFSHGARTRKPCPGCGIVCQYRHADSVCSDCRQNLDSWKTYAAQGAAEKKAVYVTLSEVDYGWPGFYNGAQMWGENREKFESHREGLTRSLHALAYRLAKKIFGKNHPQDYIDTEARAKPLFSRPDGNYPLSHGDSWFHILALMNAEDIGLFNILYDHIAQFSHLCYLAGVMHGRNLLAGLASGDVNLHDLEEKNVALAQEVQEARGRNLITKKKGRK